MGQIGFVKCDVTDAGPGGRRAARAPMRWSIWPASCSSAARAFEDVHVDGAGNVAEAAAAAGRAAPGACLGHRRGQRIPSRYAQTKAEGEERVRAAFPAATILRPSIVFGPEDDFFNKFAGLARLLPALPLIGGGNTRFQPVFVGDVAAAIAAALDEPQARRARPMNWADRPIYSFKELMEIVLRETGRKRLLVPLPFAHRHRSRRSSCSWCPSRC